MNSSFFLLNVLLLLCLKPLNCVLLNRQLLEQWVDSLNTSTSINLINRKITEIDIDTFTELPNLKDNLYLYNNDLTNIEPYTFKALNKLENLYLYNNGLNKLNDTTFEGLENLKYLSI